MKKFFALSLLANTALAGNYISLQALQSTRSETCTTLQTEVDAHATALYANGYQSVTTECNENALGGRIAFGEQFSKTWGVELGYQNSGQMQMEVFGDDNKIAELNVPMTAADLALTFRTPVLAGVYFTARAGAARWNIEYENGITALTEKNAGTTAQYGVGVEWLWLIAGYNVISKVGFDDDDTQDVKQGSVGVRFKF